MHILVVIILNMNTLWTGMVSLGLTDNEERFVEICSLYNVIFIDLVKDALQSAKFLTILSLSFLGTVQL